jgi:hypothetical protein
MWRAKFGLLFLGALFSRCALGQENQTLADVLKRQSIPSVPASVPHLNSRITSYATLNDDREFLIAYYIVAPQNELRFPLFMTRFDKPTGKWEHVAFSDLRVTVQLGQQKTQSECIGSVLRIEHNGTWYYLNLHWNPSAGCLVVLNRDLSVSQTLTGWSTAFFKSGLLVYSGNMVHFADLHPETLLIYDPITHESQQLYPPEEDPFRRDFSARLARAIDRKQCAANNWACNPERFASVIGPGEVNDETQSLAFRVDFSPEGFVLREEAEESGMFDDDQYVYVYQLKPLRWREFSIYDLKPQVRQ